MEDLSTMQTLILVVGLVVLVPLGVWYLRRAEGSRHERQDAALAELEKEAADVRQQQHRKGTHDQHGHRLCITCGDKQTRATNPAYEVRQSEDFWDLVKRSFGAPARYTIKQRKRSESVVNVYCDECSELMKLEHEEYVLRYEAKSRQFRRDAGVELRRWLKHGCNDAVARLIEQHDERVKATEPQPKRATVVPLNSDANGT